MTFADQMKAIAQEGTVIDEDKICAEYNQLYSNYNGIPGTAFSRLTAKGLDLPVVASLFDGNGKEWTIGLSCVRSRLIDGDADWMIRLDVQRASATPQDVGKIKFCADMATSSLYAYMGQSESRVGRAKGYFESYLAANFLLGKIYGRDMVAEGVYASPDAPIRKVAIDFGRKYPTEAEWAIEAVDRFTWQPKQRNLDFGQS